MQRRSLYPAASLLEIAALAERQRRPTTDRLRRRKAAVSHRKARLPRGQERDAGRGSGSVGRGKSASSSCSGLGFGSVAGPSGKAARASRASESNAGYSERSKVLRRPSASARRPIAARALTSRTPRFSSSGRRLRGGRSRPRAASGAFRSKAWRAPLVTPWTRAASSNDR